MVDAAVAAVGAAAVVFGPEVAAGAAVLKTGELIWEASEIGGNLLMVGAGAHALATGVSTVVGRPAEDFDPFDEPPAKRPRPDHRPEIKNDQQTDAKVPQKDGETETETEYDRHPIVFPAKLGDYAGIQKTMYNPVTGDILGLKMIALSSRGKFKGSIRNVISALRRSKVRVHSVKTVAHSPVSVLGMRSP